DGPWRASFRSGGTGALGAEVDGGAGEGEEEDHAVPGAEAPLRPIVGPAEEVERRAARGGRPGGDRRRGGRRPGTGRCAAAGAGRGGRRAEGGGGARTTGRFTDPDRRRGHLGGAGGGRRGERRRGRRRAGYRLRHRWKLGNRQRRSGRGPLQRRARAGLGRHELLVATDLVGHPVADDHPAPLGPGPAGADLPDGRGGDDRDPSGRQLGEGGVERRQLGGAHRHLVGEAQTLVGEPGRDTADEEAGDRHREGGGGRPGRRHGGHRFGGGGRERHRPAADRHPGRRRDGAGHHGAVGAQLAVRRRGAALHDHRAAVTAPGALGGGSGGGLVGGDDVGGGDPARGARGAAAPGLGGNGGRRRILGSDQRRVAVVLRGRPEERLR